MTQHFVEPDFYLAKIDGKLEECPAEWDIAIPCVMIDKADMLGSQLQNVRAALGVPDGADVVEYAKNLKEFVHKLIARVDSAVEQIEALERNNVKARSIAEQYEKDWYAAKSEFGDAMAKANARYDEAKKTMIDSALLGWKTTRLLAIQYGATASEKAADEAIALLEAER
jgi:hypothetical protein